MRRLGAGGRSSLPQLMLTVWFGLASAQLLLNSVRPPLPTTNVDALLFYFFAAVVLAVVTGVATLTRRAERVFLPLVLLGLALMTAVTIMAASGQGQIMAGLYLMLLGVIAAMSMGRRTVIVVVGAGLVGFEIGAVVNPVLDSPGYAVFVGILILVVSLIVSTLVGDLRDQALHDQLTGALNRRGLEDGAALAHALAGREGRETAVVEIDLDGFKRYNDVFGHAAGDERLAQTVSDWRGVLRRTDLLARVGGDEFVIVLPGATANETAEFLGRMRAVNEVPWTAGVSTWKAGETLTEAFNRADVRMYDDKKGRPSPSGS